MPKIKVKLKKAEWWPVYMPDWHDGDEYEITQEAWDVYYDALQTFRKARLVFFEALDTNDFLGEG